MSERWVTEERIGLTERELRAWIEDLRQWRVRRGIADEIERAIDAAKIAGLVIPGHEVQLTYTKDSA